ncbi:DUF11 domain-containing protein [Arsenicibacter rosenii]|uniref:DUF11 domain-containing protein n=1 Tax=Arsenicibacter rosenii TaxID=1750698 RepID=A0A1S2VCF1_9BACT|nr:DUF11 domain-containing protein [Arsenicibacter rosenii]OIN55906.1 hypothetical protein BLX24_27535 [Arsenicibacter rosenii]
MQRLTSIWFCFIVLFAWQPIFAQIHLTYPTERMVVQRNNNNQATVQVAGSFNQQLDQITFDVINRISGATSSNVLLLNNPANGQFTSTMTLAGGWWQIIVKGIRNNTVVARDTLQRFGVGEVLAIMGHSDAQGSTCIDNTSGSTDNACPTLSGASDDRVSCIRLNDNNNSADFSSASLSNYENTADPAYLPGPGNFAHLDTYVGMAPFARFAWFWGYLGDLLVQQLGVPVLFFNGGFGGSNMEHNYKAAYDIPFTHGFVRYDLRMPYANMRSIMNLYTPTTGIRGVLLLHGENDRGNDVTSPTLQTYYKGVIDKVRSEFNMPSLAWSVAVSDYAAGFYPYIRDAQLSVIQTANYNVYRGPDLGAINSQQDRPDGIHYSPTGQQKVALAWASALLSGNFFTTSTPYTAQQQPLTSIACATGNQLVLYQSTAYARYVWDNGPNTQSIMAGPGTYSLRVQNSQNRYFFPPAVVVPANVAVSTPAITPTSATLCATPSVTLTSGNSTNNAWSTGAATQSIVVTAAGTYSLQAVNPVYGCLSAPATATISAGSAPAIAISPANATLTSGQSLILNAVGCNGGQLRWSTGSTVAAIAVSPTSTTGYSVSCSVGTCTSSASTTVFVPVSSTLPYADLSLKMAVSNRTPQIGDAVTFTLSVKNSGPGSATTVSFENRLPPNLSFVSSSSLTHANGIVSGTITNLAAGSTATRTFLAQPLAPGTYQNAAEIMTSTNPDLNSQPGTGTADGQDDAASVDFRTRVNDGAGVYVSPNPNQVPLPGVQPNQPVNGTDVADLSLWIVSDKRITQVGQTVSLTVTVLNGGGATATNVSVGSEFPAGLQFFSSPSILTYQNGLLSASLPAIPAGQRASFSLTVFVTATGQQVYKAQVMTASPADPDSKPANGSFNGEDDTASLDIRVY